MHTFHYVAECGSFSEAGRRLGMPKQTVSRKVALLETELGVTLFHRTTRRVRLTPVGSAYALRCAEVVRLAEEASRWVKDQDQRPEGALRISADPVFAEAFLTPHILRFSERHPQVELELHLTRRMVDIVEEGFDAVFRIGGPVGPGLSAVELGPARIRYCAAPGYLQRRGVPRLPEDLEGHNCLVLSPEEGMSQWPFFANSGVERLQVRGNLKVGSFRIMEQATLGGLGIGLFPEPLCRGHVENGRLVGILDQFAPPPSPIQLVFPARRMLTTRLKLFVESFQAWWPSAAGEF